ncbi:prolyl oligopeptidase family serine peptidase [Aeoliella sp. ICT_H6.2]|uniref:Prolyl oligopeptidase family serine peptidase n=1 Tax=Aeoliella straminimaris TaxID=2954799 RepID=A0A9X2JL04_9BACT|nr:prolyl oligopeptidase family serine peptidase [Aeoliella straminimaris]
MPIEFSCPACGKTYRVEDELAGRSATCKCGTRLIIPELLEPELVEGELLEPELVEGELIEDDDPAEEIDLIPDDPPITLVPDTTVDEPEPWRFNTVTGSESVLNGFVLTEDNPYLNPDRRRRWSVPVKLTTVAAAVTVVVLVVVASNMASDKPTSGRKPVRPTEASSVVERSLLEQRSGFATQLVPSDYNPVGPAPEPPPNVFRTVHYDSPAGSLVAYLTPKPRDQRRRPALVWAHGGFGGIDTWLWEQQPAGDDQSVRQFLNRELVVMCPSWRGENDNPGEFEFLYGEVEDLIAAGEYVAQLPYVDPQRVYVGGHSNGATLAMLAAECDSPFRAALVFGGDADLELAIAQGDYKVLPFNPYRERETVLRSPDCFAPSIRIPVLCFEGSGSSGAEPLRQLAMFTNNEHIPLEVCVIEQGGHFDILRPLKPWLAEKLLTDIGEECSLTFSEEEANEVFTTYWEGFEQRKEEFSKLHPIITVEASAVEEIKREIVEEFDSQLNYHVVWKFPEEGGLGFTVTHEEIPSHFEQYEQHGMTFCYDPNAKLPPKKLVLEFDKERGYINSKLQFYE